MPVYYTRETSEFRLYIEIGSGHFLQPKQKQNVIIQNWGLHRSGIVVTFFVHTPFECAIESVTYIYWCMRVQFGILNATNNPLKATVAIIRLVCFINITTRLHRSWIATISFETVFCFFLLFSFPKPNQTKQKKAKPQHIVQRPTRK